MREQLRRHAWAHFSCHGDQQLDDPPNGGLLLHDGILTVAELASDRYRGEFAFLSACKTAVGGVQTPDEAITLAAALQCPSPVRDPICELGPSWSNLGRP